ncbi:unnamed protein product, partial [Tuber aestivum]
MIIYFLIKVVDPPVFRNRQNTTIPEDAPHDQIFDEGGEGEHHVWYARDIENLPGTTNQARVGQLLDSFFEYYSHRVQWGTEVIFIRTQGGIFSKYGKGGVTAVTRLGRSGHTQIKDRHPFAIADPFEISRNVGRICNATRVDRVRAEFKRAWNIMRVCDGEKSMREHVYQKEPPEKPWVGWADDKRMDWKSNPDQSANRETNNDT